jgi:alkaline phosphatase
MGVGARKFNGFYDNTDIAKRIAELMGIQQELPIEKK